LGKIGLKNQLMVEVVIISYKVVGRGLASELGETAC